MNFGGFRDDWARMPDIPYLDHPRSFLRHIGMVGAVPEKSLFGNLFSTLPFSRYRCFKISHFPVFRISQFPERRYLALPIPDIAYCSR